jgi:hypothetical protein
MSPQISEEFSTAAYRFCHSIISPTETKVTNDGLVLEQQDPAAVSSASTADYAANGKVGNPSSSGFGFARWRDDERFDRPGGRR